MSQGPLDSAIARKQLVAPLTIPLIAIAADATAGTTVATFIAPHTAQIIGVQIDYGVSGGTAPKFTANVRRGTTTIASSAQASGTAPQSARASANAYIQLGETLTIQEVSTAADNTNSSAFAILELQLVVDPDAA